MKYIYLLLVFLVFLSSCAEGGVMDVLDGLYVDSIYIQRDTIIRGSNDTVYTEVHDTIHKSLNIKIDSIVKYMDQQSVGQTQGASCYNNYLFDVGNNMTYIHIYDMDARSLVKRFRSRMSNILYHCNNACFSNIYYSDEDQFPLLFVSQQRTTPKQVHVCRISGELNEPNISLVCVIMLPTDNDLYIKNSADIVLNNDNNTMYAYAITNNDYKLCTYQFDIPDVLNNDSVFLTKQDIKEMHIYNSEYRAKQGAVIKNGFLYVVKGIPNRNPLGLTIINLYNHSWKEFDLFDHHFGWEPEGLFFYNEELYCTTNYNKGVYKICLSIK